MIADTILIIVISILTALLGEEFVDSSPVIRTHILLGLTFLLVYRTDTYKRLNSEVEKSSRKHCSPVVEKRKEVFVDSAKNISQRKKLERSEEKLKNMNRDLSMVKMKSMFVIGFTFTSLMGIFNSIFDGRVVAKLPFVPIPWLQGLSHRNILGTDYTDCSYIFFYIICTMSIRQNIQKMLGVAPSRAASRLGGSLFTPPQPTK